MDKQFQKEEGVLVIYLVLLLVIAGGLAAYWYLYVRQPSPQTSMEPMDRDVFVRTTDDAGKEAEEMIDEGFEEIVEDESTPEEINNQTLQELDELILSVEGDEDLTDLGEY